LGFPDFYGANFHGLVDCWSSMRSPEDKRLRDNGLGEHGTPETPAVGKVDGANRIAENRSNRVGCK
jgi:hypothetical protein